MRRTPQREPVAEVVTGDCLETLRQLPDAQFSGVLTDPPYGLKFMGKDWDKAVPAVEVWAELLRVCKPGAHALVFGGTRTHHRLMVNIEDAGWEIRDVLCWLYGSGFPKSMDVSKALDKAAGAERRDLGPNPNRIGRTQDIRGGSLHAENEKRVDVEKLCRISAPATPEAQQYDGYGTALKPAWEPVILARKPLSGTVAQNVLEHGCGALAIDACRVAGPPSKGGTGSGKTALGQGSGWNPHANKWVVADRAMASGRWPANVILDEEAGAQLDAQSGQVGAASSVKGSEGSSVTKNVYGAYSRVPGAFHGDDGGASRFFYCAKASKKERGEDNNHPTVKPLALCEYLAKLILPATGTRKLLVPFSGSGSEMLASINAGWPSVLGIERNAGYADVARRRIGGHQ